MINFFPILLYPEIHYHIWFLYPFYFRKLPEIIADLPYRIDLSTKNSIPILIIAKDAKKFPISLDKIRITIQSKQLNIQKKIELNHNLNGKYFSQIIEVDFPEIDYSQRAEITIIFHITRQKDQKEFVFENDNLPGFHTKFTTYLAKESLPKFENWFSGDPHFHSNFTDDQVEFGADINSAVHLAKRMNLDWFFVTDHSYDLDDCENNYLKNNPEFPKWKKMKNAVKTIQKEEKYPILFGEELSCGNSKNRNVHLLLINNEKFIQGSGDSAEKWFRNNPSVSLQNVRKTSEKNSLLISAHTFENFYNLVQMILLKRGAWNENDIVDNRIQYLQILNRKNRQYISNAKRKWIKLLLEKHRIIILAGNDAHGHFNVKRAVKIPLLCLFSSNDQIFGNLRTFFKSDEKLTAENFISEFQKNRICVTDGPLVNFSINNSEIGSGIKNSEEFEFQINAISSEEFGMIKKIIIFSGDFENKQEKLERNLKISDYKFSDKFIIKNENQDYFRVEIYTKNGKFCWTNPIWIDKK